MLGKKLLEGSTDLASAWNFGPDLKGNHTVQFIVNKLSEHWPKIQVDYPAQSPDLHEACLLNLDCSKANAQLGWQPTWDITDTLQMTIQWYRQFYEEQQVISRQQLQLYVDAAKQNNMEWAQS